MNVLKRFLIIFIIYLHSSLICGMEKYQCAEEEAQALFKQLEYSIFNNCCTIDWLHFGAAYNRPSLIPERQDVPDKKTKCSGLHYAALYGHEAPFQMLKWRTNKYFALHGFTPLHCAAFKGYEKILDDLLGLVSSEIREKVSDHGLTLMHCAMLSGNKALVRALFNKSLESNHFEFLNQCTHLDKQGITPIHLAAFRGDHATLAHLFVHAVNAYGKPTQQADFVETVDGDGNTPLHVAVVFNRVPVIKLLIEEGANPFRENGKGSSAIDLCQDSTIRELLSKCQNKKRSQEELIYEQAALRIARSDRLHPKTSTLMTSDTLSEEELAFKNVREEITIPTILQICAEQKQNTDNVYEWSNFPCIGLAFSGGGVRAMLATLGFLLGLRDAGILDSVTYSAGLSGSTWLLIKWLEQNGQPEILDIIKEHLKESLVHGLETRGLASRSLSSSLFGLAVHGLSENSNVIKVPNDSHLVSGQCRTESNKESASMLDIWSLALARLLFSDRSDLHSFTLSSLAQNAMRAAMPLPICTAITGEIGRYSWYEFTPFTSSSMNRSPNYNYIPTWGVGRKYSGNDCRSAVKQPVREISAIEVSERLPQRQFYAPEPPAAKMLGAFSSAWSLRLAEASKQDSRVEYAQIVTANFGLGFFSERRIMHGLEIPNFEASSKRRSEPSIELRDAGIDFNLPLPPLVSKHRKVNIILIFDASGDLHESNGTTGKSKVGDEMRKFLRYAKENSINLSHGFYRDMAQFFGNFDAQDNREYTVLGDVEDQESACFIYIPLLQGGSLFNPTETFSTYKFAYEKHESEFLIQFCRDLAGRVAPMIKKIIHERVRCMNKKSWW